MKKTFRKALSLILAAVIIFGAAPLDAADFSSPLSVSAKALEESGKLTDTISWSYNGINNLIISGTGAMPDFDSAKDSPFSYMKFDSITIDDGITSIGAYTFARSTVGRVTFYNSMKNINDCAFQGEKNYENTEIYYYCDSENAGIDVGANNDFLNGNIHCFLEYNLSNSVSAQLDLYNAALTVTGGTLIPDCASPEESPFADVIEYIHYIWIDSVRNIGSYTFANADINYLILEENIDNINANAFSGSTVDTVCYAADTENMVIDININPVGNECIAAAPHSQYYEYNYDGTINEAIIRGTGAIPDCGWEYDLFSSGFLSRVDLYKLTIEEGITRIGAYSFYSCPAQVIEIADSVTSIGEHAFGSYDNKTKDIKFGNSLEKIDGKAFIGMKGLTSVDLPESLKYIGESAFAGTGIKTIRIPHNVSNIGDGAFATCKKLKSIIVDPENEYYCTDEYGVLYNKNKTRLIQCPCADSKYSVCVPASTEIIADSAFSYVYNLMEVVIESPYVSLGNSVFDGSYNLSVIFFNAEAIYYYKDCSSSFFGLDDATVTIMKDYIDRQPLEEAGVKCVTYTDEVVKGHDVISFSGAGFIRQNLDAYRFIRFLINAYPYTEYFYFDKLSFQTGTYEQPIDESLKEHVETKDDYVYLSDFYVPVNIDGEKFRFSYLNSAISSGTLSEALLTELEENPSFIERLVEVVTKIVKTIEHLASGALKTISNAINKVMQIFKR